MTVIFEEIRNELAAFSVEKFEEADADRLEAVAHRLQQIAEAMLKEAGLSTGKGEDASS